MNYGLTEDATRRIRDVLARHAEVEQAILYGSRAKGNYKAGSDVDLTLLGTGLTPSVLARLAVELDESPLPYRFDLSILATITHAEFLDHIRRVGVVFYERENAQ